MHFSRWWGSFHLLTVFFFNSLFRPCPFDQDCCPFTKQTVYRWALDTHNCIILFFLCMFDGDNTFPWNALNMTGRWDYTEGLWEESHILIWTDIIEFKSECFLFYILKDFFKSMSAAVTSSGLSQWKRFLILIELDYIFFHLSHINGSLPHK